MHRSRLSALAIFAGAAACSTRGDSDAKILSQDHTPAAALDGREKIADAPVPGACAAAISPAQPTAAARSQADALARQGYRAEVLGNTRDAHALLLRASELDGTDGVAAYHLGRASEALGDRTGAVAAYCRYLALSPTTAESAEARQRVAMLSPAETRVSAGSVSNSAPTPRQMGSAMTRRVSYPSGTARARVGTARSAARPAHATPSRRRAQPARAAAVGDDGSAPTDATIMSQEGDSRGSPTSPGSGDAATPRRRPAADQSPNASRTANGGLGRVQSAGMGAVTGAIIGTAAGRSVKSAILGAAAGGLFGAVVGGRVD